MRLRVAQTQAGAGTPRCADSPFRHSAPTLSTGTSALRGSLHCPERQPRSPYSTPVQWNGRQESFQFSPSNTYTSRTRPQEAALAKPEPAVNTFDGHRLPGRLSPLYSAPFHPPSKHANFPAATLALPPSSNAHLARVAGKERRGRRGHRGRPPTSSPLRRRPPKPQAASESSPCSAPAAASPMIVTPIPQQRTSLSSRNGLGRGFGARGMLDGELVWLSDDPALDGSLG